MPDVDIRKLEHMFNMTESEQYAVQHLVPPGITLPSFEPDPLLLTAENIADILDNCEVD